MMIPTTPSGAGPYRVLLLLVVEEPSLVAYVGLFSLLCKAPSPAFAGSVSLSLAPT